MIEIDREPIVFLLLMLLSADFPAHHFALHSVGDRSPQLSLGPFHISLPTIWPLAACQL